MKVTLAITSLSILAAGLVGVADAANPAWPQWGGPNRNFTVEVKGLANSWPAAGPRQLWTRPLGDGYSGISVEGGKLYTMYRGAPGSGDISEAHDVIVALDAATGKTSWEYHYPAAFTPKMQMENGPGPHATPLILGNRLYTVGVMGLLHCMDTKTGKVIWSHNLYQEFNAPVRGRGYSPAVLQLRLQWGKPGYPFVESRKQYGAQGTLVQQQNARPHRQRDPDWGLRLWLER